MTDVDYDVIVAGSGPSGGQFARYFTRESDYSLALLERDENLGDNDKSTAGSFPEVVDERNIPDWVVMDENEEVILESPNEQATLPIHNYVLDFPALQEFLGQETEEYGGDIYTDARVVGPIRENNRVKGVEYANGSGETKEMTAQIVVDATGPASVIASELGLFDKERAQNAVGLEYEARGNYEPEDAMVFSFDHEDAPGGYAWTFPSGDDVFKAGVCYVDDFREKHGDGRNLRELVDDWVEDDRWEIDEVRAEHGGRALSDNSINQRATDGFMAIGDSVSSINPLFGEGIRPGMESADMAAQVAIESLKEDDISEESLRRYDQRWNQEKGRGWRIQKIFGELIYDFNENQQDEFVRRSDQLSEEEIEDFMSYEIPLRTLARLYPFEIKDLKKAPELGRHLI